MTNIWRVCLAVSMAVLPSIATAQSVEDFYKQKTTLTLIHGAGAGSTYHVWGQIVARHMPKYIPGRPRIIVEAMPGGGGIVAGNFLYKLAPKDGSTIASLSRNLPLQAFLGKEKGIAFDPREFNWLGSVESHVRVCAVLTSSGALSIEDLLTKEVTMGGTGPGSGQSYLPTVINRLVGTKFKVVTGYRSDQEINLAIQRGEVSGTCGNYDTIAHEQQRLIQSGQLKMLFNLSSQENTGYNGIPWIGAYIKSPEDKRLFTFITAPADFGRPFLAPPGVPADRLAALKAAFDKTMSDTEFAADVAKVGYELIPSSGETLRAAVATLYATPKDIVERANAIMPAGAGD